MPAPLLRRLKLAAAAGAALAGATSGCHQDKASEPVPTENPQPEPRPLPEKPSEGPEPKEDPAPKPEPLFAALEPYAASALGCYGPEHDDGYYGQCCVDAFCYAPEGDDGCVDADDARSVLDDLLPAETGECSCPVAEEKGTVEGPYAPIATDEGKCCYLSGSISCEGRAFLMGGEPRIARIQRRSDWLL